MKIEGMSPKLNLEQHVVVQGQAQRGALGEMKRQVDREVQQAQQEAQENRVGKSEEIQRLLEEIKRKFDMLSKYLRIDIDTELEIPVAKIIERDTNRIIRQIPPDYLLDLMKKVDQMLGILLRKEV